MVVVHEVLAALDPEQRAVAEAPPGPVCVLAGAGTGKTRAITHRIAYQVLTGQVTPSSVLAVTFTVRAAAEMRERLHALGVDGVQARTFHSAALRQLSYFWPRAVGGAQPTLIESKYRLVAAAAQDRGIRLDRTELRDAISEIEWAKSCLGTPDSYPKLAADAGRRPPIEPREIARLFARYEQLRDEQGVIDFESLLLLTWAAIVDNPEIAEEFRRQYRTFVVDEYQDVNPLQQQLLDAWLGDRDDLTVVGDPNQTIYSFTGATSRYLTSFPRRFERAQTIRLFRDYRSTEPVVELANTVIGAAPGSAGRLEAFGGAGPEPAFARFDDEPAEADGVAARIAALIASGVSPSEIAVLYRINAQSEVFEQALAARAIPYIVRGGERFFDRPEVKQAIVLLRGAAKAGDGRSDLPADVRRILAAAGYRDTAPSAGGQVRERWESLAAIVDLAETMDAGTGLDQFVAELESRAASQNAPVAAGVTLASLHSAKGLEWDAVFLVGLIDGTLPIIYAETAAEVAEEKRLLYVGITRARKYLTLSWGEARHPGGRSRRPSRFIESFTGVPRPPKKRPSRKSATCRVCGKTVTTPLEIKLGRCAGCPGDIDAELAERLRVWRSEFAVAAGQPAYCIFTDVTMLAIAERKPTNLEQLQEIPGIGPAKLERFGQAVLALVAGEEVQSLSTGP